MANYERKIDEVTGKEILVYESGMVKDAKTGWLLQPATKSKIQSSEQAREMAAASNLKRKEAGREKIREEVLRVTNEANIPDLDKLKDSADAFAVGVGLVWDRTVLSQDSYPRDAIDGLKAIDQLGDFVTASRREAEMQALQRLGFPDDEESIRKLAVFLVEFDRPNLCYVDGEYTDIQEETK